jgi:molybdate transport system substrate-binding protein
LNCRGAGNAIGLLLLTAFAAIATAANGAELHVVSGRGFSPVLDALRGQFEATSGHKLMIQYGPGHAIRDRVVKGEVVDLVILPRPLVVDLAKQGKIVPDSVLNLARSDVGLGIRAGASRPDVNSIDAFKRWLLEAKSIVCSDPAIGATTSVYFTRMLERLGIADQVKPKVKFVSAQHTADYVARGEADIAVQLGNEILEVPGVDFIPLPSEFQTADFIFAVGVASATKDLDAAKAFIRFLSSPEALKVIRAKHLEPG